MSTLTAGVHRDGHHTRHTRVAACSQDQRNGASNRDPAQRRVAKIKGVEESFPVQGALRFRILLRQEFQLAKNGISDKVFDAPFVHYGTYRD
jgi:hypothetical protein